MNYGFQICLTALIDCDRIYTSIHLLYRFGLQLFLLVGFLRIIDIVVSTNK